MVRRLLIGAILAFVAIAAAFAYQAVAQDRDFRALLGRGDAALRDEQTFAAIEAYSGAIALRPDSTIAHLRRGEAYQRRGDLHDAARDFRRASALDRSAARPLEELGDDLAQLQQWGRSAEAYEASLKLDDRQPRVSYKLALARFRHGETDSAMAAASAALRLDDSLADAHYLLALCLRAGRRLADAQHELDRALEISPGLIAAREELADLFGASGRYAEQLQQLQVLAGLDREHATRQLAVGLAQAQAGHGDAAVLTIGGALERAPDQADLYLALGRVWLDRAIARNDRVDLSKAVEALERAAAGPGATSEALALYGRALLQDGQLEAAESMLQQATERLPVDPSAFLQHARIAERLNHPDSARRSLIAYEALTRDDAEFSVHAVRIAVLSAQVNDHSTALAWLERAARETPEDASVLVALASEQLTAGDRTAALETIARATRLDSRNPALTALVSRARIR